MKIKTRIIGIIVFGITCLFVASFIASQELNKANREYSAQESIIAHSSAWTSNMDIEFKDKLLVYDPTVGAYENTLFWEHSAVDPFERGDNSNPLFDALESKNGDAVTDLMSSIFANDLESENSPLQLHMIIADCSFTANLVLT